MPVFKALEAREGFDTTEHAIPEDEGPRGYTETEDGGIVFDDPDETQAPQDIIEHDANLALFMDEGDLDEIAGELQEQVEDDTKSREEWEETYIKGLDLLGLKIEEDEEAPFEGASAIRHPLVAEAVYRYQARAMKELMPPRGPFRGVARGSDPRIIDAARESQSRLNRWARHDAEEYFAETDQLLLCVGIQGAGFRKDYYDPLLQRPTSRFIPSENLIASFAASSLHETRVTEVIPSMPVTTMMHYMHIGAYRSIDLGTPQEDMSHQNAKAIQEAKEEITGIAPSGLTLDQEFYRLHEIHTDLIVSDDPFSDEVDVPIPYIVTIETGTGKVLSIRRNWRKDDEMFRRRRYYTAYRLFPALSGIYGYGYVHLIGNPATAINKILNATVDAGQFANMPAGFKSRSLNIDDNDAPLSFGELRDVDAPDGDLNKGIVMLPFRGPNPGLVQLMQNLEETTRRLASTADSSLAEMKQEMPVGTTLALLDKQGEVDSVTHQRLYQAQYEHAKRLKEVFAETVEKEEEAVLWSDQIDIMPASDPSASSKTERMLKAQERLNFAMNAKQHGINVNMRAHFEDSYRALGDEDIERYLPPEEEALTGDALSENTAALAGRAIKPSLAQHHDAHMQSHMAFIQTLMNDPMMAQSSQTAVAALQGHIVEHFAMKYTIQTAEQLGIPVEQLAEGGIPPEIEQQIAVPMAQAAQQILAAMPKPPNPEEVAIKTKVAEVQAKGQVDKELTAMREEGAIQRQREKIEGDIIKSREANRSRQETDRAKLAGELRKGDQQMANERQRNQMQRDQASERHAQDMEKSDIEIEIKEIDKDIKELDLKAKRAEPQGGEGEE
ncbi:MAG: hypothetical protein NXI16_01330 [Alphaproteobacteria bacterium]|nr:hypothetical protein [Alphaproteobacteria bacterium]